MFNEKLADLRKKRGLSQYKLADELGFSRGQIANYEQGKREPDFETLKKLAEYFNVTTDYLLGRETERVEIKNKDGYVIAAHAPKDMTPEQIEELERYAEYLIKRDNL